MYYKESILWDENVYTASKPGLREAELTTEQKPEELVTVIGSDLFDLDDDIKQYLQDPTMPLITAIKIGLCYYITSDHILQLNVFKDYLEKINPFIFFEVFGKQKKDQKIC